MDCTIQVSKRTLLINCTVSSRLISTFIFKYAKADFLMTSSLSHMFIHFKLSGCFPYFPRIYPVVFRGIKCSNECVLLTAYSERDH